MKIAPVSPAHLPRTSLSFIAKAIEPFDLLQGGLKTQKSITLID